MLQTDKADKRRDSSPVRVPHMACGLEKPAILSRQIAALGIWAFGAATAMHT
jgi:hypothetical protein